MYVIKGTKKLSKAYLDDKSRTEGIFCPLAYEVEAVEDFLVLHAGA